MEQVVDYSIPQLLRFYTLAQRRMITELSVEASLVRAAYHADAKEFTKLMKEFKTST